ncbi:MAG: hypothetical protein V1837_00875 [Candidatus Woesearchaeota archaeon]
MMPVHHLWTSLLLAIALYPFFGIASGLAIAGGVLLDIDHYVFDYFKFKRPSLKKWYAMHKEALKTRRFKHIKNNLYIFHTIELMAIFLVLGFINRWAEIILFGIILHRLLDAIQTKHVAGEYSVCAPSIIIWAHNRNQYKSREKIQ